jgi:hypothetical protein
MNCASCQEHLQRYLDGEPAILDQPALAAHLSSCPDCREWHAAAGRLLDGLRLFAPPQLPKGVSEEICRQIQAERARALGRRRLLVSSALAAGLLVVCSAVYFGPWSGSGIERSAALNLQKPSLPSFQRSIEEAGLAVVALTRRTADETVNETRLLLPADIPQASVADSRELAHALEPAAEPLREIQEGVSAGLEPLTTSARRAVGLFLSSRQWSGSGAAGELR